MNDTQDKRPVGRPKSRPDAELLDSIYGKYTATQLGRLFNVSPSTVRGWMHRDKLEEVARG